MLPAALRTKLLPFRFRKVLYNLLLFGLRLCPKDSAKVSALKVRIRVIHRDSAITVLQRPNESMDLYSMHQGKGE